MFAVACSSTNGGCGCRGGRSGGRSRNTNAHATGAQGPRPSCAAPRHSICTPLSRRRAMLAALHVSPPNSSPRRPAASKGRRSPGKNTVSASSRNASGEAGARLPLHRCAAPISEFMLTCPCCGTAHRLRDRDLPRYLGAVQHGVHDDWHYCAWCYGPGFRSVSRVASRDPRYTADARSAAKRGCSLTCALSVVQRAPAPLAQPHASRLVPRLQGLGHGRTIGSIAMVRQEPSAQHGATPAAGRRNTYANA